MTPRDALAGLRAIRPAPLDALPSGCGIYALLDHEGEARYLGSTSADSFRQRIWHRHVTGSEQNSHKFSWAYSVGRMWRDRKAADPLERADGGIAKRLRTSFVRRHCRAACLPLDLRGPELVGLEMAVKSLLDPDARAWNDHRLAASPVAEPGALVTRLVGDLGLDTPSRAALDRQSDRFCARRA